MIVDQTTRTQIAPSYSKRLTWLLRRLIQADNLHTGVLRKRYRLSPSQLACVIALDEHGPMPLSQIAKEIMVDSSTVTGLVDRLEKKRLVERSRNTLDRRVVTVSLTEAGRSLACDAPSLLQSRMMKGLERLPLSKKELIIGGLTSLTELLDLPRGRAEEEPRQEHPQ